MGLEMSETERLPAGRIDIDNPRWNQSTFIGRLKHFAWITDFRNALVPSSRLLESKHLLQMYRYDIYSPVMLTYLYY